MTRPAPLLVVERYTVIFRKFWRGPLTTNVVSPLLFLAAIGFGVGGLVTRRHSTIEGLTFVQFVTPGLVAASALQTAAQESLWPVMGALKWIRTFHAMVATPIEPRDVYAGVVLWSALRAALGAAVFLAVAAALGGVHSAMAPLALPVVVFGAAAMAAPLTAFTATQETDLRFPVVMRLGIIPMYLFSGTFFPVSQLPGAVRLLVWVSPLYHTVTVARRATSGTLGHAPVADLAHLAVLGAFVAAGAALGTRAFDRRLRP